MYQIASVPLSRILQRLLLAIVGLAVIAVPSVTVVQPASAATCPTAGTMSIFTGAGTQRAVKVLFPNKPNLPTANGTLGVQQNGAGLYFYSTGRGPSASQCGANGITDWEAIAIYSGVYYVTAVAIAPAMIEMGPAVLPYVLSVSTTVATAVATYVSEGLKSGKWGVNTVAKAAAAAMLNVAVGGTIRKLWPEVDDAFMAGLGRFRASVGTGWFSFLSRYTNTATHEIELVGTEIGRILARG